MTATTRATAPTEAEVWLSIQDASAMLGVSPATLRRWSAAGEVEAFTTPGGHRRFALSTLRGLLPRAADGPLRLSALGESAERLMRVVRRHARSATHESSWIRGLDGPVRDDLRDLSRAMTESLVEYLDAAERPTRDAALEAAESSAARLAHRRAGGL